MNSELDGGSAEGTSQTTNSGGSNEGSDKRLSFDATKLQSAIDSLSSKIGEIDARTKTLQGDKDRGVQKAKTEVEELKRKIAEIEKLKKAGLDEDGAIEEHSFREDIRFIKEALPKLVSAQAQPAGNSQGPVEEVANVLKKYGLPENDPAVAKLYGLRGDALRAEAADMALSRKQSPVADSSAATALGASPAQPPSVESATKQYIKDMQAAQGDPARARQIRLDAIAKGVPVDTVVFH
jgi:outer membrane murein-binding lipoprotein Lpp